MKRWFPLVSLGFSIGLVLTAFVRTQASPQGPVLPQTTPDTDKLFAKIYPVFAHDRCANCHGKVQHYPGIIRSVTPQTHPGGDTKDFQDDSPAVTCGACHDEPDGMADAWQFTAPDQMEWAGKTMDQMCAIEANQVRIKNEGAGGSEASRAGSYLHHLNTDPLVTQAFEGWAGGARLKTDKLGRPVQHLPLPPLTRTAFLAGATEWVNAGAPCRTTGTITQVELFKTAYTHPSPAGQTKVLEYARREVTILSSPDGTAVADISATGWQDLTITHLIDGCTATARSHNTWDRTGPAHVIDEVDVSIKVLDGRYEIHFGLPEETTKQMSSSRGDSSCGGRSLIDPPDYVDTTWNPWEFRIRCPTAMSGKDEMSCDPLEPRKKGTATGWMKRIVLGASDATERQSWLNESPVATNRTDTGAPLPVSVTTRWDLKLSANKR